MSGLLKAMQTVGDIPHLDPLLCAAVPEQVTIEQAINVVVRYGEAHPKEAPLPSPYLCSMRCMTLGLARRDPQFAYCKSAVLAFKPEN